MLFVFGDDTCTENALYVTPAARSSICCYVFELTYVQVLTMSCWQYQIGDASLCSSIDLKMLGYTTSHIDSNVLALCNAP